MKCPVCSSLLNQVMETRVRGEYVYRRRRCFNEHLFTTQERIQTEKPKDKK
jgi:hypothetical protein